MFLNKFLKIFPVFFFVIFFFPQIIFALDIIETSSVTISAKVISDESGGGGGGGSGGSYIKEESIQTSVNFSGIAYPLSKVFILKDGQVAATTVADLNASFHVSLIGLSSDTYTFSIYGEDTNGRKSSFFSFPILITSGTIVNISNIFLSPTIEVDKSEVKKGDPLVIFGQSAPKSKIFISVILGQEYFYNITSNTGGFYSYSLDTSFLEFGKYQVKTKAVLGNQISPFSVPVFFLVGKENKKNEIKSCFFMTGDLNCDGHVNLIDFSIMAFWYKKNNPPEKIDQNNDGKINLVDFSILAFYWTG